MKISSFEVAKKLAKGAWPACFFITTLTGIAACQTSPIIKPSKGHLTAPVYKESANIPPSVTQTSVLQKPKRAKKLETYTVVVDSVPIKELLFSMARDGDLNLDIDQDIIGLVTINAVNQTMIQILDRISELHPIRYSIDSGQLRIRNDSPYIKPYRVDYLNMGRVSTSEVKVSTQIAATGQGAGGESGGGGDADNNSSTTVANSSTHAFWDTIIHNINSIVSYDPNAKDEQEENESSDEDSESSESSDSDSAESFDSQSIIVNRESGIIAVRATQRQHKEVQAFLDGVMDAIQRQVLIEATIAEVTLNDTYKAGVDWSALKPGGNVDLTNQSNGSGSNAISNLSGIALSSAPAFLYKLTDASVGGKRIDVTIKALEQFGDVKIMSSPKVMALNNQTALLKVVDNLVYFSVEADSTTSEGVTTTVFSTEIHTVPIGFVMSVTPFIDEYSNVTLNVRPTISRVIGTVKDPNPTLAAQNVTSDVPVIQVREVESILKVSSGDTAVIGGLMQDDVNKNENAVPFLSRIPILGNLFKYKDNEYIKTELVIFIRPVVVNQASLNKDLKQLSSTLTNFQ